MMKRLISLCLTGALILFAGIAFAKQKTPAEALLLLGKSIYNDKNLSINNNQSCKSCHHNNAGFADMTNVRNPSKNVVSVGSIRTETGGLNAPTAAYAAYSPSMYWDGDLFIGGIFWNGRAHGHKEFNVDCLVDGYDVDPLFSPLAEQAQGPFTNPVEMALPDNAEVVARVTAANYSYLFHLAFGTVDFYDVDLTFDQIAIAIAFFEESDVLNQFSSDYDTGSLTNEQLAGSDLFMDEDNLNDGSGGGAMCVLCHVTVGGPGAAMFTDFSYDNLGIPLNPIIADKGVDPGLGGFIQSVLDAPGLYPVTLVDEIEAGDGAGANWGKHKVSTLRNIALTPPYGHNGFFPNLTSIVQFYNTRDPLACSKMVGGIPVTPALLDCGKIPGYNGNLDYCWPAPEIADNMNVAELGNLGLTSAEVDSIVAFLEALTD
jgi:cytochrome c peroxidase